MFLRPNTRLQYLLSNLKELVSLVYPLICHLLILVAITPYRDIANAPVIIGVCCDMCPEKERYMREYQANLSIFEMVPGTQDNRVCSFKFWRTFLLKIATLVYYTILKNLGNGFAEPFRDCYRQSYK